ncbi:MAG: chemotaxis protein CheW [Candidatus Obscuribacterales bacterium]|nr:chemotaxis protein CheW [Candidatus Obscuribacterales bacterium]
MDTVVVFKIDEQPLALPVSQVQRVIWAVEITAMPGQSDAMLGMINVEGAIIPVVNIRHLLALPNRELDLDDHIVMIKAGDRSISFIVDKVEGVLHYDESEISTMEAKHGAFASGVLKLDGELIVVLNAEQLLHESVAKKEGMGVLAMAAH